MKTAAIFASGNGSNFEAIIKYFKGKDVEFVLITDVENSYVRERAKRLGIQDFYVNFKDTYDFLLENKFDLHILAGYMKILPKEVLELGTFINIHPSYLPEFKGINSIQRAYDAKSEYSGVTIHYVNEEVDAGEIIFQEKVSITPTMTLIELGNEIHSLEHYFYPRVIENLLLNSFIQLKEQAVLS